MAGNVFRDGEVDAVKAVGAAKAAAERGMAAANASTAGAAGGLESVGGVSLWQQHAAAMRRKFEESADQETPSDGEVAQSFESVGCAGYKGQHVYSKMLRTSTTETRAAEHARPPPGSWAALAPEARSWVSFWMRFFREHGSARLQARFAQWAEYNPELAAVVRPRLRSLEQPWFSKKAGSGVEPSWQQHWGTRPYHQWAADEESRRPWLAEPFALGFSGNTYIPTANIKGWGTKAYRHFLEGKGSSGGRAAKMRRAAANQAMATMQPGSRICWPPGSQDHALCKKRNVYDADRHFPAVDTL